MNWEKGNFLITANENGDMVRHNVTGITSSVGKFDIGIHKAGGWVVTDISTGYQIRMCETQKQAKSWVEENQEMILKMLSKPQHENHVEQVSLYPVIEA